LLSLIIDDDNDDDGVDIVDDDNDVVDEGVEGILRDGMQDNEVEVGNG
jgi:hypothetical protein